MVRKVLIYSVFLLVALSLTAAEKVEFKNGQSAMFFKDGGLWVKKIVDMSSRTKDLEFLDETKLKLNKIWMINFLNRNWNFPNERSRLNKKKDTLFLKNGDKISGKIVDFSSKRRVFEFEKRAPIHVSKIKRIYMCCTVLPEKYKEKLTTLDKKKEPVGKKKIKKVRKRIIK